MQNNPSLHLKHPDPSTACTFHRSFYCSLIHRSILQLFTDPSTIQPFIVHWSIAWSPTHSACILINSLLPDESLKGFLHDLSLELLPDPTHVTSIAPAVQRMQHPSRLYVLTDPSLYLHRYHHHHFTSCRPWGLRYRDDVPMSWSDPIDIDWVVGTGIIA